MTTTLRTILFALSIFISIPNFSQGQTISDLESAMEDFRDAEIFTENFSLDITHNQFLGDINGTDAKWNSIGLNLGFMSDKAFGVSDFSFAYGFRFAFNNFRNNGYLNIVDSLSATQLEALPEEVSRDKYKFTTNFFELPLELRFRHDGADRMIRFTLGGVIGWRMRVFEHWTDGDLRYKEYNYADVNKFRYGAFARLGFKNIGLYAGYYFTPIFKNSESSTLNILNFGLNIAF